MLNCWIVACFVLISRMLFTFLFFFGGLTCHDRTTTVRNRQQAETSLIMQSVMLLKNQEAGNTIVFCRFSRKPFFGIQSSPILYSTCYFLTLLCTVKVGTWQNEDRSWVQYQKRTFASCFCVIFVCVLYSAIYFALCAEVWMQMKGPQWERFQCIVFIIKIYWLK